MIKEYEISWSKLAPPYRDYNYLEKRDSFPFRGEDIFDLVDAWWMSELSSLAYFDEPELNKILEAANLVLLRSFFGKTTECFVIGEDRSSKRENTFVVFRGSELRPKSEDGGGKRFANVISDWVTNIKFELVDVQLPGMKAKDIKVHKGFKEAIDEIWLDLNLFLKELGDKCSIWFTGHSQGAALATLAAAYFQNGGGFQKGKGLYTFGSPRVGNDNFLKLFNKARCHRIANGFDCVCYLPFFKEYEHLGQGYKLTDDRIEKFEDKKEKIDLLSLKSAIELGKGKVPKLLEDHVPILYSHKLLSLIINDDEFEI